MGNKKTNLTLAHPRLTDQEVLDLVILSKGAYDGDFKTEAQRKKDEEEQKELRITEEKEGRDENRDLKASSTIKPVTKDLTLGKEFFNRDNFENNRYNQNFLKSARDFIVDRTAIGVAKRVFNLDTSPEANAQVFLNTKNNTLVIAFRGTEFSEGDWGHWVDRKEHYDLYKPLFEAVDKYIKENGISNVQVTGHSLGAAMAEMYMKDHPDKPGDKNGKAKIEYNAVTFASPDASLDPKDDRVLNIGNEWDVVHGFIKDRFHGPFGKEASPNNTSNIAIANNWGTTMKSFGMVAHNPTGYVDTVKKIQESKYRSTKNVPTVVDRTKNSLYPGIAARQLVEDQILRRNIPDKAKSVTVHIIGEKEGDNEILDVPNAAYVSPAPDILVNNIVEGGDGNDTITVATGPRGYHPGERRGGDDTLDGGKGNDFLRGNAGKDRLIGGEGKDTAEFSGKSSEYRFEEVKDKNDKLVAYKVIHKEATKFNNDGEDTIVSIENFKFKDKTLDTTSKKFKDLISKPSSDENKKRGSKSEEHSKPKDVSSKKFSPSMQTAKKTTGDPKSNVASSKKFSPSVQRNPSNSSEKKQAIAKSLVQKVSKSREVKSI